MPAPTAIEKDPWLEDDGFGRVDFNMPEPDVEHPEDVQMIAPDLDPQVITNVPEPEPEPTPVAVAPEPEDEPLTIQNEDGSSIEIVKSTKGWKGTVDLGYGSTQVFYGKTKNELLQNLMVAQLNATKKIREQNRKIKLGATNEQVVETVQAAQKVMGRQLTADEKFELKTQLETDPDQAFDTWFQKRTGNTLDALLRKADAGEKAQRELTMEQANIAFLAACPTYYKDAKYENFNALISYLAKHKLRRGRKPGDEQEIFDSLVDNGHYTAQNLEEAFTELTEDGLLLQQPRSVRIPEPTPVAPAPAAERIVRTETRPRAGLGIRTNEVTQSRTPEPPPPSVNDYNSLTDEQLETLIAAERKKALGSRR